jgi:hypothetical protein
VSATGPACPRTKVKVVVRRCLGPVVPIQGRDEWKWSTTALREDGAALEPPAVGADDPPPPEGDCDSPATAAPTGAGAAEDDALVTVRTGSGRTGCVWGGIAGSGTGAAGTVTVTVGSVGTGGTGTGSAAAVPADSAATTPTRASPRSLMSD